MNKNKVIERIESELLPTLLNYVVPFVEKKIKSKYKKPNNLENIVNEPKFEVNDIRELESLLAQNLSKNIRLNKKTEVISNSLIYSLSLTKRKNNSEKNNKYSVSIKYEENGTGERLKISIKKDDKEAYSTELTDKKGTRDRVAPYSIVILYEDRYGEERLSITYRQQLKNYMQQHANSKEDMSNMVPLKWLNILPETMMGGILGFTYLGDNSMGRRADLTGKTARMVDIHESIHTPDEYETRVLTSWIMEKARGKYIK